MRTDLRSPKIPKMENVTAGSAVATDFECMTSQGQARLTENISLISLSHLHHQISVKLNHFPLKGQTSVTHSGGGTPVSIHLPPNEEGRATRGQKS